jgi:hypothetical protein
VLAAWYAIAGQRGSIITKTVPVELRGVTQGLEFEPPRPIEVTVHLRGPRRRLVALDSGDLTTSIDLSAAKPGKNELAVFASAPTGIEILRVVPAKVRLDVR